MTRIARAAMVAAALVVAFPFAPPAMPAPGPWVLTAPHLTTNGETRSWMFVDGTVYAAMGTFPGTVTLLRSNDYGVTWSERTSPGGGPLDLPLVQDLVMATPNRGFGWEWPWDAPNNIFRTDDGAGTWRLVGRTPAAPRGYHHYPKSRLSASPQGHTVAFYESPYRDTPACPRGEWPKAAVSVSRDGGVTWQRVPLPFYAGDSYDMRWWDDRTGAVTVDEVDVARGACWAEASVRGHRSTVWTTRDAGRTWQRSAFSCPGLCLAVTMASARRIVVAGPEGAVYASDDGGRTARRIGTVGNPQAQAKIAATEIDFGVDPEVGYAVTNYDEVYRTTDGGRTWTLDEVCESTGDHYYWLYRGVSTVDGAHAVALTSVGVRTRLVPPPR